MTMRLKLLLLLLFASSLTFGQEPYRNLIFSEVNISEHHFTYFELTNMGDKTIDLSEFEVGVVTPWTAPWTTADTVTGSPGADYKIRLPKKMLAPGESYLVSAWWNLPQALKSVDPERWLGNQKTSDIMMEKADLLVSSDESGQFGPGFGAWDTITPGWRLMEVWGGREAWFLRHFYSETDSMVVDAVNACFDNTTSPFKITGASDAAGVTEATRTSILIRKANIKEGVGEAWDTWTRAKGVDMTDSEWLPSPMFPTGNDGWVWGNPERLEYWTLGNHGNFLLNNNSLQSSTVRQNWVEGTLTVDYGARKCDGLMKQFEYRPGLTWFYKNSPERADSAFNSVRTGDTLIIYAFGTTRLEKKFALIAAPPGPNAKVVIPKNSFNPETDRWATEPFLIVTENQPGMDTITANPKGLPFAYRVDSLIKYLEKPANASWGIVWVDGKERPDLKLGDKLKVTAQDGSTKEYFLKVGPYVPSHNAFLSAITWPEIPEWFVDLYGWEGDTIPNFNRSIYDYVIDIPAETEGFPAFIPMAEDLNAKIVVERAVSLSGSAEDRSILFHVTAEDDTTDHTYSVVLNKLKADEDVQPWAGDPFISQFVWQDQWANGYIEVVNPGNQILDLSNYMFAWGYANTPADAIARRSGAADWANRYAVYIPGYKWPDQATWETNPRKVVQDLNVNPIVYPGDVFVIGDTRGTGQSSSNPWWGGNNCDIDLATGRNPWGETVPNWEALQQWNGANWYLFRIDNDSITRGLKAAIDPNDFTLIDVFGSGDGSAPVVGGKTIGQTTGYTRKPQVYKGNPDFKGSFGTDAATSEWLMVDRNYFQALGVGWPADILRICDGLGTHFMNEVTVYKSTVGSLVYKVSEGYSMEETIRGVTTGTDVNNFLAKIIKANEGQTLRLKKAVSGVELGGSELLGMNDSLVVLSADGLHTSRYILNVTTEGLSKDARLTTANANYTITVTGNTGEVTGFDYGTTLQAVLGNLIKPLNSVLTVIDQNGAYVAMKKLNFDTVYVDTKATDQIYLEVVAEDGETMILYQLKPNASASDAFVTSDSYEVNQDAGLIGLLPRGTTVATFFKNVIPVTGASVKLVDKLGFERTSGEVTLDDKLIVTSQDGKKVKIYFLSMLKEEFLDTKYPAYVTSNVYTVDQQGMVISGPTGKTLLTDFYSKIIPAFGASVIVINANGDENKTADLNGGDRLKVIAADGVTVAWYMLNLDLTSDQILDETSRMVYPNPTQGKVYISGLASGNRIRVFTLTGTEVLNRIATGSVEEISLGNQPSGMYFITVSEGSGQLGKYKIVKH